MDYFIDQLTFVPNAWKPALKNYTMNTFRLADWFCGTRDPREIIEYHTSYLGNEVMFYICGLLTLIHAWRSGGRYWYLWLLTIMHGLNTESLTYFVPDFENFWHSQTMVMFLGRRLPFHIILLYPIFDYTSMIAAKRLRLPWWAEGCAAGLGTVLLDLPYDIMGVKLLWWTWHDTDPNVYDRIYHVPWTSLYFHAAFAASEVWLIHLFRKLLVPKEYDWKLFHREFLCCFLAAVTAFWVGAIQFIPLYHFLHDYLKIHAEVCTLIFLFTYAFVVYVADRKTKKNSGESSNASKNQEYFWLDSLFVMVLIHFAFYMSLVWMAQPEFIQSKGLHEPIGPCNETIPVQTVSGMVLRKRKYLCVSNYDEPYFHFNCPLNGGKPPKMHGNEPVEWYTICGTKFPNHAEYIAVIYAACIFGLVIFLTWFSSGPTPEIPVKKQTPKIKKTKKEKSQ